MGPMSTSSFNRPGAIDLSQLAAQAQAGSAAGDGGSYVVEVTEGTFDGEVIRPSLKYPVVVELYSPRVNTGQQLSDALAALAAEASGKFRLARLNVDAAPQIVQALQLQAVPTVIGVIGGQLAPLFQGVLTKEQVKPYVDELIKAAVANGIVGRADPVAGQAAGDAAEEAADPRFEAADAALARGDFTAAREEFEKLLAAAPNDPEALAGRAQAGLLERVSRYDPNVVLAAAAAPGASLQVQLDAADVELAQGDADAAFNRLLALIRTAAGDERERARVRLLELFETLGNTDERVLKARRGLMTALF